jgi:hypothetical protein
MCGYLPISNQQFVPLKTLQHIAKQQRVFGTPEAVIRSTTGCYSIPAESSDFPANLSPPSVHCDLPILFVVFVVAVVTAFVFGEY